MLIKVSETTNNQINWLVTKIEGHQSRCEWMIKSGWAEWQSYESAWGNPIPNYSTDWSQGGPIIELEGITLRCGLHGWDAELEEFDAISHGPTPLIAAMRCYVASELGDTVEVPEELL